MTKRWTFAFLMMAALAAGTTLSAAEEADGNTGETVRSRRNAAGDVTGEWAALQAALKEKYPEKFAEIEKLQNTNLFAALEAMRSLAESSGMELPRMMPPGRGERGQRRGGPGGDGMNFGPGMMPPGGNMEFGGRGEHGQRRGGPGGDGMRGGPGMGFGPGGMGMGGSPQQQVENELKEQYPEEFAEIEELRQEANRKLQDLAEKAGVKLPVSPQDRMQQIMALREKYPEEFAEIEELRRSNPRAAMEKMTELASKEGIDLSFGRNRGSAGNSSREGTTPRNNQAAQLRRKLLEQYPDKMAEIDALRKTDAAAARKQLQELIKQYEEDTQ